MCLSCICLLAMHTLICVTFSLPAGVGGWMRLLLVALPGLFCLSFLLSAFVWEKRKTMCVFFSETIVVCDIKVGRYSQLNEYMKFYEYPVLR